MKNTIAWAVGLIVVGGATAYFYYFQNQESEAPVTLPLTPVTLAVPEEEAAEIQHPIVAVAETQEPEVISDPLPSLEQSDGVVQELLSELFGQEQLDRYFRSENLVDRFVATVDSLPRTKIPEQIRPVNNGGEFQVREQANELILSPDNYIRYDDWVALAESADTDTLIDRYTHYYPLFQQAYDQLGNPGAYFNDRLVEVIDHLLATPTVSDEIRLIKPEAFYLFEDPELEALSAGQKALIRMGSENASRIKYKLRQIRSGISTRTVNSTSSFEPS